MAKAQLVSKQTLASHVRAALQGAKVDVEAAPSEVLQSLLAHTLPVDVKVLCTESNLHLEACTHNPLVGGRNFTFTGDTKLKESPCNTASGDEAAKLFPHGAMLYATRDMDSLVSRGKTFYVHSEAGFYCILFFDAPVKPGCVTSVLLGLIVGSGGSPSPLHCGPGQGVWTEQRPYPPFPTPS